MKPKLYFIAGALLAALFLVGMGCRNPVAVVDGLEKEADKSDRVIVKEAQKEAAGTQAALAAAPKSRPVEVAAKSNERAIALLNQANGPLTAEELSKRVAIVEGQLSAEQAKREAAESLLSNERKTADGLIRENVEIKAELAIARGTLKEWALERDATAKTWERIKLGFWVLGGLIGASILIPIAASVCSVLFPAAAPVLGIASKLIGYVVSPAIQYAKDKAVKTIESTGKAIEELRIDLPDEAGKITRTVDSWVGDDEHLSRMGRAAETYRLRERPLEPRAS